MLRDSGAVLFDEASGTVIAVSVYCGATSDSSVMATPTSAWEPCGAPDREDVYCRVQRSVVVGNEVTFRSRLVMAPRSALLLQTLLPGYLNGTGHDESIREILREIARKSSQAEENTEPVTSAGPDNFQRWLLSQELGFAMMAAATERG